MAYPLINGAAINEDDAAPGAASLRPVIFGSPSLRMTVASLRPVSFGLAQIKHGTDVVAAPLSISPTRFGAFGVIGGMPPNAAAFPASSLRSAKFGRPSIAGSLQAGQVGSLQPVKFGAVVAGARYVADALRPASFGVQVMTVAMPASPLRPTKFGGASTGAAFTVAPLDAARFGVHTVALPTMYLPANSLQPVQFGPLLTPPGQSARARGAMPVRFGRPSLDRGVAC